MKIVQWHAVWKEDGKVCSGYFHAPEYFALAEAEFQRLHPGATYWEIAR